jgi:orotate phosphoribosyltransferase-like protein
MSRIAKTTHPDIIAKIIQLKKQGVTNDQIRKDFGVSRHILMSLVKNEMVKGNYSRPAPTPKLIEIKKPRIDPIMMEKVIELKKEKYTNYEIALEIGITRPQVIAVVRKAMMLGLYATRVNRKLKVEKVKTQSRLETQLELDEKRRIRPNTVVVRKRQGFVFRSTPNFWLFQN